ncbi:MAG: hypothetical protein DYG89_38145 [Caldilinea sp. CFX5]|nr:hypothetical protein [Caldilinea sp. CFX5]
MSDSIPEAWKTDNLFLLIGGNPLPNYVAAQLLRKDTGLLHLVSSPDTEKIAKKLSEYFPGYFKIHPIQDPADHGEIKRVIEYALRNQCKSGTIGLHYTGGTKAMAIHTYQAMSRMSNAIVFTYLDSHTKTIRCDGDERKPEIQYLTTPEISTLFDIHNIELTETLPEEWPHALFPQLEEALAKAHGTSDGIFAYDQWCNRYLRVQEKKNTTRNRHTLEQIFSLANSITDDESYKLALAELRSSNIYQSERVEKASQFFKNPIPFPDHPKLLAVVDAMRQSFNISGDAFDPQAVVDKINRQSDIKKVKHLVKYLDGTWMEYWTLSAFLANKDKHNLHSVAMSLKTRTRLDFEFDVAAMQGYQMYAVSCTRSDEKELCKGKLFEAFTRATQMGGEEAHVGLVCAHPDPQLLQKQVAEVWRTENNRMRVFGTGDLSELPEKFAQWLSS